MPNYDYEIERRSHPENFEADSTEPEIEPIFTILEE